MNLIRQLRTDIVDDKKPVSAVLRRAKILAAALEDTELSQWLSDELNGYQDSSRLPSYRRLFVPLLGTFSGPFGSSVSRYQIPMTLLPETVRDIARELICANPVREIEAFAESAEDTLRYTLPTEAVMLSRDSVRLSGGFVLVELYQPVSRASFAGVLDAVRTRFLDFLLALQQLEPSILDSEAALERLPPAEVTRTFNVTVMGGNNIIAADSKFGDVSIQAVKANDIGSLAGFMSGLGIAAEDVTALQAAVEEDGEPKGESLGRRVTAWVGGMLAKAVAGTWSAALGTAPEILKEALFRYYGWK